MHELKRVDKADGNEKSLSLEKAPRNDLNQTYLFHTTVHRMFIDTMCN